MRDLEPVETLGVEEMFNTWAVSIVMTRDTMRILMLIRHMIRISIWQGEPQRFRSRGVRLRGGSLRGSREPLMRSKGIIELLELQIYNSIGICSFVDAVPARKLNIFTTMDIGHYNGIWTLLDLLRILKITLL